MKTHIMAPKQKDAKKGGDNKKAKGDASKSSKTNTDGPSTGGLKPAQSIQVRHILCEKNARREEAIAALNSGRSFDDVAREFSEDKARQGGSLGWKTRGSLIKEFENVAFETTVSKTGNPVWKEVKTSEGYHVLMVEGRK